ncbi:MAG: hydroxymethylbilane synthase [Chloroflexi bacterium]|nr:hydroxymethylbilane synthase [Chloroflexota bacterium]
MTPSTPTLPAVLRVATRGSVLALRQTNDVVDMLRAMHPEMSVEIVSVSTPGDRDKSTPLTTLGQGVFVKGVEEQLLDGRVDVAVHSLKDVPTAPTPGLEIGAYPLRADPRDGLVCRVGRNLASLPERARVATGSPRRAAQLLALRSDLQIVAVRGNLDTRLRKLRDGEFDGLMLAVAGLQRLNRLDELDQAFEVDECTPAAGQGTLAVQCRTDDAPVRALLARLDDAATRAEAQAERAFLAALGGGCELPAGAVAQVHGSVLHLIGVVASADGRSLVRERIAGGLDDPAGVGRELAERLLPRARVFLGPSIRSV